MYRLLLTDLQLQDSYWQWGSWTTSNVFDIFKLHHSTKRPYEFPNNVHFSVTYEHDLNLTVLDRHVYSSLDWLGDVGGLGEALFFLGSFVLAISQFGKFDSMMTRALFRAKSPVDGEETL